MLRLTNTMTGKKEEFKPMHENQVQMYVCGVTPYDRSHIGHGRVYVAFDILYRLLQFLGYEVSYCRNFTDIDDKLLAKALDVLGDALKFNVVADKNIEQYHDDMRRLRCLKPTVEPRVTEHMECIIQFIQKLIEKGFAYQANGDVYFRVERFSEYGKLSKQKVEDLISGARVDVNEKKENPLDFALWKAEPKGTFWQGPWGSGRPGWHIECSALAEKYLGKTIDIHGGGLDLIFPHHENEVAQSEALHSVPFANYWLHNGLVKINKEKMSKSLGNVLALQDMMKQYDPMVIRFYFLNHHYRAPLDFSYDDLESLKKSYQRLCNFFAQVTPAKISADDVPNFQVASRMLSFLVDDVNTVGMLGVVFESLELLAQSQHEREAAKAILTRVLGLTLEPIQEEEQEITPEVQELIDEREKARAAKDWARADEIRDQLIALGIKLQDKKS